MDRINAIRTSLTAFVCGLIGLLPVIGVPFGVAAIVIFIRARRRKSTEWNPAEHYIDWGARFGLLGLVLTLIGAALFFANTIQQGTQTGHAYWPGGGD